MVLGRLHAELLQRRQGQTHHAQGLGGPVAMKPAAHGEDAVVGQVVKIVGEGFHRVEAVFAERVGPRGGGRPGVHQARLDDVPLLIGPGDIVAPFIHHDIHVGQPVELAAQVGKILVHGPHHEWVQFHAIHLRLTRRQGRQHIPPAARPDDQHIGALAQAIGQVGHVVEQIGRLAQVAVVERNWRCRIAINQQQNLLRHRLSIGVAVQPPPLQLGVGHAVAHDAAEAVPGLEDPLPFRGLVHAFDPVDLVETQGFVQKQEHRHEGQDAQRGQPQGALGPAEDQPRHRTHAGNHHDGLGRRDEGQQRQRQRTADARANQVGKVDAVDPLAAVAEGQRNRHAGQEEGNGGQNIDDAQLPEALPGDLAVEGNADDQGKEQWQPNAKGQHPLSGLALDPVGWEAFRPEIEVDGAHSQPKERQGDGHKGEVIPHGDAEDAGQRELEHEGRHGSEGDGEEVATCWHKKVRSSLA